MAGVRGDLTHLETFPAWGADLEVLPLLRQCFTYGGGDDRATGSLYAGGEQDWPLPLSGVGPVLLGRLAVLPGVAFTLVAFQAYAGGSGCGWHADTPFGAQAILSLGVTRTFEVRRRGAISGQELRLRAGDLVYMPAGFQDEWEHRVPVEDVAGERCSLVFRTRR